MSKINFLTASSLMAALAAAYTQPTTGPSGNPVTNPSTATEICGGKPFDITWSPTSGGTVTIVLYEGPATNLKPVKALVEKIPNSGKYTWTPESSLPTTTDNKGYGIQIIADASGEFQWSAPFGIDQQCGGGGGGYDTTTNGGYEPVTATDCDVTYTSTVTETRTMALTCTDDEPTETPIEPTDCTETPVEPTDCTETPVEPTDCTETPEEPTDCTETPLEPTDCTETPAEPTDCTETPEEPTDCTETPEEPTDCTETPEEPTDCTETPDEPTGCTDCTPDEPTGCTDCTPDEPTNPAYPTEPAPVPTQPVNPYPTQPVNPYPTQPVNPPCGPNDYSNSTECVPDNGGGNGTVPSYPTGYVNGGSLNRPLAMGVSVLAVLVGFAML